MTHKDSWSKGDLEYWRGARVAMIGAGAWGTVLANQLSLNCQDVRVWLRDEESARAINATRSNPDYLPDLQLSEKVHASTQLEKVFEGGVHLVVWALPSKVTREQSRRVAPFVSGSELLLHASKGVEPRTLKRMSDVLAEEMPLRRIGVISGPNLAAEMARGEPAATVVASAFDEVCTAGQILLAGPNLRVYRSKDVPGVEWAGTLKNVLAIASGALEALKFGLNSRSAMITRGLAEMVRFGVAMGGKEATFMGLAGVGDVLATCGSSLSRNYRVGFRLGSGEKIQDILEDFQGTAEGIETAKTVAEFASQRRIDMPITQGVALILRGESSVREVMLDWMSRPPRSE